MRVCVNISPDLLQKIDERAKAMYVSRSSYIAMALSATIKNEDLMAALPTLAEVLQRENEEAAAEKNLDKGGEKK